VPVGTLARLIVILVGAVEHLEVSTAIGYLDAFIDYLRGGFGKHKYNQPIKITWTNTTKSKKDLGYPETINVLKKRLGKCHPSNRDNIQKKIELAEKNEGKTMFDEIIDCINDLKDDGFNVLLILQD
jgi:hypothetical protein